ncbi:MAG: mobile mystery protein B [Chloroflexota bacterium]|nr:mobile mystery protein B [Chloroflexota bacterium]
MNRFEYPDGATPIDPDEAKGLILTHITTRGELDRWEQDNIAEALAWLEKIKPIDILNGTFIRKLHQRMFKNVWRWAGEFRLTDKNIGVHWWRVPVDVKTMCDDVIWRVEHHTASPDILAIQFHHRLVSIHPFPNGNGRHARLMTDLFLENILQSPRFSWGGKDLSKGTDARKRYILALYAADNNDYDQLVEFARS